MTKILKNTIQATLNNFDPIDPKKEDQIYSDLLSEQFDAQIIIHPDEVIVDDEVMTEDDFCDWLDCRAEEECIYFKA